MFYSSVKDRATGESGKKLDGHICDKDYLTCNKIWNEFTLKNMGDHHGRCLKKDVFGDNFEKLIDTCLNLYKLDLCH